VADTLSHTIISDSNSMHTWFYCYAGCTYRCIAKLTGVEVPRRHDSGHATAALKLACEPDPSAKAVLQEQYHTISVDEMIVPLDFTPSLALPSFWYGKTIMHELLRDRWRFAAPSLELVIRCIRSLLL